ncbi:hypothetical protein DL762_004137 [Monosporascus cannonballus]|uniref:Uncharacterized protein n=1 Tax=Monosporascus cannonballus TaxID=155416 RepID=A0ABY0HBQ9_9PEZI|nr:hypothetical protein DL763_008748 [Monosporascus cannonballus]RYO87744.1 hypothetical protein DL762_004137 [Monosporascus cannonballus]
MAAVLSFFAAFFLLLQQATLAVGQAECETSTTTQLAIASSLADYSAFLDSMNNQFSTSGASFTGETVFVWTSVETYPGGSFTAYGVYDSNALTSAGYSVITETATVTSCSTPAETTETESLPPSPTGSLCSPHGDHWHCEATSTGDDTAPEPTATCEPHGDHWHCPPGVEEPSTPPAPDASASATSTDADTAPELTATCEPHGDHWHCPPGVEEPTTPPAPDTSTSATATAEECEPHGDHWHCPSGVEEPSTPPPMPASTTSVGTLTTGTRTSATTPDVTTVETNDAAQSAAGRVFEGSLLALIVAFFL